MKNCPTRKELFIIAYENLWKGFHDSENEIFWVAVFFLDAGNIRRLIFGTVINIVSILYHNKNQVGGSCVGGVSNKPGEFRTLHDKSAELCPANIT